MSSKPWYKRYGADFIAGTLGMTLEEKGAYSIILDLIYDRDGGIPDEPRYIAGVCGCSVRKWNGLRARLIELGKIQCKAGIITNLRADKELQNRAKNARTEEIKPPKQEDYNAENAGDSNENNDLENHKAPHSQKSEVRDQITTTTTARPDYDDLATRLFEAGGAALNQTTTQLTQLNTPLSWLSEGCDLELDIVQTIRRLCEKKPPNSVSTWRYFTPAIAQAKADRETPLPEVSPNVRPLRTGSHQSHLSGALQAAEELERSEGAGNTR